MTARNPFDIQTKRRRRRRRGISLAGLVAALLTTVLYQCNRGSQETKDTPSKPTNRQTTASRDQGEARAARESTRSIGKFDFYLLDLTVESAWCEDGNQARPQCQMHERGQANKRALVLHGLWPENLAQGSYPSDCQGDPLALSEPLRRKLLEVMPGAAEGLERHEWTKHGRCTGLDPETYFDESIRATERVASAVTAPVSALAGEKTSADALRARIAKSDAKLADSLVFICKNLRTAIASHRKRPYLVSVRACIDNDGAGGRPGTLLRCATVNRRDQGCGDEFYVDDL